MTLPSSAAQPQASQNISRKAAKHVLSQAEGGAKGNRKALSAES
jgi:hypothetical protein